MMKRQLLLFAFSSVLFSCSSTVAIPTEIVEQVIDHPDVEQYFHPESPGRASLTIASNLLAPGIRLSKFGRTVQILPEEQLIGIPHLRFDSYFVEEGQARVLFQYEAEGMHGDFLFEAKSDGSWQLTKATTGEYDRLSNYSLKPSAGGRWLLNPRDGRAPAAAYPDR